MQSSHLSVRIDDERRAQLEAMADHRELDLSKLTRNVIDAAVETRQRACKVTHRVDVRCGECGLLLPPSGSPLERL